MAVRSLQLVETKLYGPDETEGGDTHLVSSIFRISRLFCLSLSIKELISSFWFYTSLTHRAGSQDYSWYRFLHDLDKLP